MKKKFGFNKFNSQTEKTSVKQSVVKSLGGLRFAVVLILAIVCLACFATSTFAWFNAFSASEEFTSGYFFIESNGFDVKHLGSYDKDTSVSKFAYSTTTIEPNATAVNINGDGYTDKGAIVVAKPTLEEYSIYTITAKISGTSELSGYVYVTNGVEEFYSHQLFASNNAYKIELRTTKAGTYSIYAVWGEHGKPVTMHTVDKTWTIENDGHYRTCQTCNLKIDNESHYNYKWNAVNPNNPYGEHSHDCVCGKQATPCNKLDISAKSTVLFKEMVETPITSGSIVVFENTANTLYSRAFTVGANGIIADAEIYDGTYKVSVCQQNNAGTISAYYNGAIVKYSYVDDKFYDNATKINVEYSQILKTLDGEQTGWVKYAEGNSNPTVFLAEYYFKLLDIVTVENQWEILEPSENGIGYEMFSRYTNDAGNNWKNMLYFGDANPTGYGTFTTTSGLFDFADDMHDPKVISFRMTGDAKGNSRYFPEFRLFFSNKNGTRGMQTIQLCMWDGALTLKKGGDPGDGIGMIIPRSDTLNTSKIDVDLRIVIGNNMFIVYRLDRKTNEFVRVNDPFVVGANVNGNGADGGVIDEVCLNFLLENFDPSHDWQFHNFQINPAPAYELNFNQIEVIDRAGKTTKIPVDQYKTYLESLKFDGEEVSFENGKIKTISIIAGRQIEMVAIPQLADEAKGVIYAVEGIYLNEKKIVDSTYSIVTETNRASTLTAIFREVAYTDEGQTCNICLHIKEKTFPGPDLNLTLHTKELSKDSVLLKNSPVTITSAGYEITANTNASGQVTFSNVISGDYVIKSGDYAWKFSILDNGEMVLRYYDASVPYKTFDELPINQSITNTNNTYTAEITLAKQYDTVNYISSIKSENYNQSLDVSLFAYGNYVVRDGFYMAYPGDNGLGDGVYDANKNLTSDTVVYSAVANSVKFDNENIKYVEMLIYDPLVKFGTKAEYGEYCYFDTGRDTNWWKNAVKKLPAGQNRIDLGTSTISFKLEDKIVESSSAITYGGHTYIYPDGTVTYNLRFGSSYWRAIQMSQAQIGLYKTTGLKIAVAIMDEVVYALADDGYGNMLKLLEFNKYNQGEEVNVTIDDITSNFHDDYISNVKVSETVPNVTINKMLQDGSGTISIPTTKVGEDLVITIEPASGYRLSRITFAGLEMTKNVVNNTLTIKRNTTLHANVRIYFEQITANNLEVFHSVLGLFNDGETYPINNKVLSLMDSSSNVVAYAPIVKGGVVLSIPNYLTGTYYYYVEGYEKVAEQLVASTPILERVLSFTEKKTASIDSSLIVTSNNDNSINIDTLDIQKTTNTKNVTFDSKYDLLERNIVEFDIALKIDATKDYVSEFYFESLNGNFRLGFYNSIMVENNQVIFRRFHGFDFDDLIYENTTGSAVTLTMHVTYRTVGRYSMVSFDNILANGVAVTSFSKQYLTDAPPSKVTYRFIAEGDVLAGDCVLTNLKINVFDANIHYKSILVDGEENATASLFTKKDLTFKIRSSTTDNKKATTKYVYVNGVKYDTETGEPNATKTAYIFNTTTNQFELVAENAYGKLIKTVTDNVTTYTIKDYVYDYGSNYIKVYTDTLSLGEIYANIDFIEFPNETIFNAQDIVYASMHLDIKLNDLSKTEFFGVGFRTEKEVTVGDPWGTYDLQFGIRYVSNATAGNAYAYDNFSSKNEWQFRSNNIWRNYFAESDDDGKLSITIAMAVDLKTNTAYMFAGPSADKLFYVLEVQCDCGPIRGLINFQHIQTTISNLVTLPYIPSDILTTIEYNKDGGDVTTSGTFGGDFNINVSPKTGYTVGAIKLNGVEISTKDSAWYVDNIRNARYQIIDNGNGSYTIPKYWYNYADIEVDFVPTLTENTYNIELDHRYAYNMENFDYAVPAGVEVTFTGTTTGYVRKGVVGEDGIVTISLPSDTYTVSAVGHHDGTITLNNSGNYDLTLIRIDYVTDSLIGKYNVGYNNTDPVVDYGNGIGIAFGQDKGNIVARDCMLELGHGVDYSNAFIIFKFKLISSNVWESLNVYFYDKDNKFINIQLLFGTNNFVIKNLTLGGTSVAITSTDTFKIGTDYNCTENVGNGGYIYTVINVQNEKVRFIFPEFGKSVETTLGTGFKTDFFVLGNKQFADSKAGEKWHIKHFKINDGYENKLVYKLDDAKYTHLNMEESTPPAVSKLYKVQGNYLANGIDYYKVTRIIINTFAPNIYYENDEKGNPTIARVSFTSYGEEEITVSVETELVEFIKDVNLTLKVSDRVLLDEYVMTGSTVTFKNNSTNVTKTATVGDNGKVSIQLDNGEYTASIPGYKSFTLTVNNNMTEEIILALSTSILGKGTISGANYDTDGFVTPATTLYPTGHASQGHVQNGDNISLHNNSAFTNKIVYLEYVMKAPPNSGANGREHETVERTLISNRMMSIATGKNYCQGIYHRHNSEKGHYWGTRFDNNNSWVTTSTWDETRLNKFYNTGIKIAFAIYNGYVYTFVECGSNQTMSLEFVATTFNMSYFYEIFYREYVGGQIKDIRVATVIDEAMVMNASAVSDELVTGNESDGYSMTWPVSDSSKTPIENATYVGVRPYVFSDTSKSLTVTMKSENYTAVDSAGNKVQVYPSVSIYLDSTAWRIYQFCCYNGSWTMKWSLQDSGAVQTITNYDTASWYTDGEATIKFTVGSNGNMFLNSGTTSIDLGFKASRTVAVSFYVVCDKIPSSAFNWSFNNVKFT